MSDPDPISVLRRPGRESGQATTEFALVLFPVLMLIAGIIYFGIGLNYWLDMQRVANQGARWAAVNNWPPDCARGSASCTATPPCDAVNRTGATLQNTLQCQAVADGLQVQLDDPSGVQICYPSGSRARGAPVRVRMEAPFRFFWVTDVIPITLRADATMRLEQSQEGATGLIEGEVGC